MLKLIRQKIVQTLWETYSINSRQIMHLAKELKKHGINNLPLDHFAVIDLPGPFTGIPYLQQIFIELGFTPRGTDYLAEKQNDFLWLAEEDSDVQSANTVLPQIVIADFRLEEMPIPVRKIIEKYSSQSCPNAVNHILHLIKQYKQGNTLVELQLINHIRSYFAGRDWPLPTLDEFYQVQKFNELIAWVLVFGRRPNHFTLSIHLLEFFDNLPAFHRFIEEVGLVLNKEGGIIKGGEGVGIAQGSTIGDLQTLSLADGDIQIPDYFVEFVWRYPASKTIQKPALWKDYFTGFIAQHADRVIESLYTETDLTRHQSAR